METKHYYKKENFLINISFNIVIPSIIMTKFDEWFMLNSSIALVLALIFPLGYGLFDFIYTHKYNLFSCVGFCSILITGGIGLLKLPSQWVPIKEASIPMIFCILVLLSLFNKRTLLEKCLFDENLLNSELIYSNLKTKQQKNLFQKTMQTATIILAVSFIVSSILNFILAKITIHSSTDSITFTKELGQMFALSYPVIVFPCAIILYGMLHYIIRKLEILTGLKINEMLDIDSN